MRLYHNLFHKAYCMKIKFIKSFLLLNMLSKSFFVPFTMVFACIIFLTNSSTENNGKINLKRKMIPSSENVIDHIKKNEISVIDEHVSTKCIQTETRSNMLNEKCCQTINSNIKRLNKIKSTDFEKPENQKQHLINLVSGDMQISAIEKHQLLTNEKESDSSYELNGIKIPQIIQPQNTEDGQTFNECHSTIKKSNLATQISKNLCIYKKRNHLTAQCEKTILNREYSFSKPGFGNTFSANEIEEKNKKIHSLIKYDKLLSESSYQMTKKNSKKNSNLKRRRCFQSNQILFFAYNSNFLENVISFFKKQNYTYDDSITLLYANLKIFLSHHIDIESSSLNKHDPESNKYSTARHVRNISKFVNLCPFCTDKKPDEINIDEIENEFISYISTRKKKKMISELFGQFFTESSKLYRGPVTPKILFSPNFWIAQRKILVEMCDFFKNVKMFVSVETRIKYLCNEYHQFFLKNNISMKLHFLPELQSIMYVLMRTPLHVFRQMKNRNFVILLVCLHSLNKFFNWIAEFYEQNKIAISESDASFPKFMFESISFLLRIAFIEPIWTLLPIHENAYMRYHFFIMQIYLEEILKNLNEVNPNHIIAMNSKILLPTIILIEKYAIQNQFKNFLEYSKIHLICLNESHVHDFLRILDLLREANIPYLSENSQALENSLRKSFF